MRDERGLSPSTVGQWEDRTRQFLQWCEGTGRDLKGLQPGDIDSYFIQNEGRWGRISMKTITGALRIFLRYAADQGPVHSRLAAPLRPPHMYATDTFPSD